MHVCKQRTIDISFPHYPQPTLLLSWVCIEILKKTPFRLVHPPTNNQASEGYALRGAVLAQFVGS